MTNIKSKHVRYVCSFINEIFAVAKVKLRYCAVKLLAGARSEVKFAVLCRRQNFTHEMNFTIEDNFTCP